MIRTQCTKKLRGKVLLMLLILCAPLSLFAQNKKISGVVVDNNNETLIGVSVTVKNSTGNSGTITGLDGDYVIEAPADAVLIFNYIGFAPKEEKVAGRTNINVTLEVSSVQVDEVVVVGYGVQKKVTLSGAVAGVKGSEMLRTKNENPQNMLTGKITGVRVWQKSSEPGSYGANFDIRGMGSPLVIIDGIPRSVEDFQRINPSDIDDISVLKDASAAIYGVRSANGVVLVTTKKGKEGKMEVSYSGSYTFQKPSGMPTLANAYDAMTLYNEKSMNNINGGNIIYGEDTFEAFRNGTRRTTDWTSLLFSDYSPQTQHDLSLSGGSDKLKYYLGMGYFFQEGFFKSGDLNYNKFNIRSNVSAKITKGLSLDVNLSAMADEQNNPYASSVDIIRNYWKQGVLYPAYADPNNTMLNYDGLDLEQNTVAMIYSDISGYRKYKKKSFQSSLSLNFDFGTLDDNLKGLSAKALVGYDYHLNNNTIFRKEYYQYAYNANTDSYNKKVYGDSSPNQLTRQFYDKQQILSQFVLNYDRTFDKRHKIGGLIGWETQKNDGDNFYGLKNLAFGTDNLLAGVEEGQMTGMSAGIRDYYDEAKAALIGRLNYDFEGRYIAEVQFRYDGSSRFAKGHQWGFFPSASAAWRVSEEPFFKSISALSFVNQLKLRTSYGILGDDLADTWNYEWLPGYTYPATGNNAQNGYYDNYAPGYLFGGQFVTGMTPKALPNVAITWYESKTFNLGVDFDGWDGMFGFSLDYFDRRRSGLFARNTSEFPTVIGATAPNENKNSDRQFGLELELRHRNKITNDLSYNMKGIATVTRTKYLTAVQNGPYKNSYDKWRHDNLNNRYQGVQFGYESAGRFNNWNDIWYYPLYTEKDVLPGDYKYQDWNGDGEINSQDEHPFAFDQTPWVNFSVNLDVQYKNFDLSLLFQGSALGSMEYKEPLYSIWGTNGGGTLKQYLDRWHPIDPTADPYDPATQWVGGYYAYTGHYPKTNSQFNRVSTAYFRLKSMELGYTLPKMKSLASANLRVFVNAYNVFTITGVKFVDPEHPDDDMGRMYPLNKTYTVGLSLSF